MKLHPKSLILLIRKKKTRLNIREDIKAASRYIGSKIDSNEGNQTNEEEPNTLETTITDLPKYDQFDETEEDPYKTRAEFSCLWELYTLKQHFCFKIRSLVSKFESNFLKAKENTIDEISNIEEDDLLYDISSANFYLPGSQDIESIYKKLKYY
jgi:hypothetical protein